MTGTRTAAADTTTGPWRDRVDAVAWDRVRGELDDYGCALTGPLLSAAEAAEIAGLYPDISRFRSTVDMRRYRFGEGEYRYFAEPFPDAVGALKQALYPKLLPIARDWWTRLGRETRGPTPSTSGSTCATPPGRTDRPRSCSSTDPVTGTRCTATSTVS
jgi:hypothetical protein